MSRFDPFEGDVPNRPAEPLGGPAEPDPYIMLLVELTGKPEAEITSAERDRAKRALFRAIDYISNLPGNERLSEGLRGEKTVRSGEVITIVPDSGPQRKMAVSHVEHYLILLTDT